MKRGVSRLNIWVNIYALVLCVIFCLTSKKALLLKNTDYMDTICHIKQNIQAIPICNILGIHKWFSRKKPHWVIDYLSYNYFFISFHFQTRICYVFYVTLQFISINSLQIDDH